MSDHPMQPTPRQIKEWFDKSISQAEGTSEMTMPAAYVARLAYAAGADAAGGDAELEACCEWLREEGLHGYANQLRAARRPKPPSLKQQALDELEENTLFAANNGIELYTATIRRAIEALPEEAS